MVPNYLGFYKDAGQIFGRGYSHKMLERVAHVAADFFADVRRFEKDRQPSEDESWIRFQKFKLLLAYIEQYMNEPARSLFLEALEQGGV